MNRRRATIGATSGIRAAADHRRERGSRLAGARMALLGAVAVAVMAGPAASQSPENGDFLTRLDARLGPLERRLQEANGDVMVGPNTLQTAVNRCDPEKMQAAIAELESIASETRRFAEGAALSGEFATVNPEIAADANEYVQAILHVWRGWLEHCLKRTQAIVQSPQPPAGATAAEGGEDILDEIGDDIGATRTGLPPRPVAVPAPPKPVSLRDQALTANFKHAQASGACDAAAMALHLRELDRLVREAEMEMHSWDGPMYNSIWIEKSRDHDEIREIRDAARRRQTACPKDSRVGLNPQEQQFLDAHNRERALVGVPPLAWDPALAAGAKAYAVQLTAAGQLVHSSREGRKDIRENLLQSLPGRSPEQMIGVWLAEKRYFRPGVFPDVSSTGNWYDIGHYTQMIWETTKRVGCASHGDARFTWLVCRYSPPGNRDGVTIGPFAPSPAPPPPR